MPSFGVFGDNKLKSEAREMASVLRYLNDSASSRKETFALKFDLDKNIVSWKDPEGEKERVVDDLSGVTTQSNGTVSRGELTVFFEPLGIKTEPHYSYEQGQPFYLRHSEPLEREGQNKG